MSLECRHSPGLRAALVVALAGSGCRSEPESAPAEGAAESDAAAVRQVVEPRDPSTSEATVAAVKRCVGWSLESPMCRADANLVVFGLGEAVANLGLARVSAVSRAREELARRLGQETPNVRMRGSRVPRVVPCGDRQLAAVVIRGEVDVPPCPGAVHELARLEGAAAEACPDWTRSFGDQTEAGFIGVGAVMGVENEALAEQTARHRAVGNALSVREVELRSGVAVQRGGRTPTRLLESRTAQCDRVTYVRVEIEVPTPGEGVAP